MRNPCRACKRSAHTKQVAACVEPLGLNQFIFQKSLALPKTNMPRSPQKLELPKGGGKKDEPVTGVRISPSIRERRIRL